MSALHQVKWKIWDFYRTNILHQKDCDNCKYFGGLMCAHVDEKGKCLGWEKYKNHPIKDFIYRRRIKRAIRIMRKYGKS